jgi:hypothetical protein
LRAFIRSCSRGSGSSSIWRYHARAATGVSA